MIRKAAIFALTVVSLLSGMLWIDSYRSASTQCKWFIGPWIFGYDGVCLFEGTLEHLSHLGWHLFYPDGDIRSRNFVCFIASRGSAHFQLVTHLTPNKSARRWSTTSVEKKLGRFEVAWYGGYAAKGPRQGYFAVRRCRFPLWFPFTLGAIYPTLTIAFGLRRRRLRQARMRQGLCVACGYDLTGDESGVCPECGAKNAARACSDARAPTNGAPFS